LFEVNPIQVTIPSNSFHAVFITGRALESGVLTIQGCRVQAPGGLAREFHVPLSTEEEEDRKARRRSAMECEVGRSKYSGLASHIWAVAAEKKSSARMALTKRNTGLGTEKTIQYMEFQVVPELPLMRIRRTSLTHGAVMLYNGEKYDNLLLTCKVN
jgi:trafficking protein particle complex subunit 9